LSFLDNTSDTSVLPVHGVPDIAIFIIVFLGFDLIMFLFFINIIKTMSNKKHFSTEEAKRIGEALGLDWNKFDVEQFRMGMDVELEHGRIDSHTNVTNDDPMMTGKIALAHLNEFPDYYIRLDKMEEEVKKFTKNMGNLTYFPYFFTSLILSIIKILPPSFSSST
jgi:hypothetical protein